jgi:hypothetical protein
MRHASSWLRLSLHGLLLALLVVTGALAPATALDLNDDTSSQFCNTLEARTARINAEISEVQSTVHATWQQQSARLSVMVSEQRSSSHELTLSVDVQRAQNIAQLRSRAKDGTQRSAVDAYQRTQAQSIAVRRKAVRQANDNFTIALKRFVADRQATQAGQVEALRIAVDDDLQTAVGECSTGVDPQVAEHDFANVILKSRQTFAAQRKNDALIVSQLATLNISRQNAIQQADQPYTTAMDHARQTLRTALATP